MVASGNSYRPEPTREHQSKFSVFQVVRHMRILRELCLDTLFVGCSVFDNSTVL